MTINNIPGPFRATGTITPPKVKASEEGLFKPINLLEAHIGKLYSEIILTGQAKFAKRKEYSHEVRGDVSANTGWCRR